MSLENVFPNKEQFDTMNTLLASIASNTGTGVKVKTFADVQQLTRCGLANKVFGVAEQFIAEKQSSVTASKGNSTGITAASVNGITFIKKLGYAHEGVYEFTYSGVAWHYGTESVSLADYGITIMGTPAANDIVAITVATSELAFDIVDFDKHTPRGSRHTHTIDLLLHDVATYGSIPFCAPQLMYRTDVVLPAGNYKFTLDHARYESGTEYDGTYMFTTTQPIPVDGGFRHTNPIGGWKPSYAKSDVLGNYITTYGASPQRAEIQTGLTVTEWDGTTECTDLGTFTAQSLTYHTNDGKHNFTERQAYGSNRWRDSVYRQWLNSDAPAATGSTISNWWTPQSVFDRVPGGAKLAGFLYGLDPDFVNSLGEVEVKTALHACDRTGSATYDITYDKVFLLSRKNVFGSDEYSNVPEGELLEYFNGATNADRIKYQSGTARWWWLRTPISGGAYLVRLVGTGGALSHDGAGGANAVVPACCII